MIGRFPWDPFPAGEPDPKGPDPVHAALYRAAVAGADAYRALRQVLRIERGVLRVGNRFVPEGRYRRVGFVALGHAAGSMALAALDALGDRLALGFVAGPEAPPAYLPFRSTVVPDGWGPHPSAARVLEASREIALELHENDLLVLLVSPGASRAILEPPASTTGPEFGRELEAAYREGASAPEIATVVRALGGGGVGGRLLPPGVVADVQTFLVDRGDGAGAVGGGPTVPLAPAEVERARTVLDRIGWTGERPSEALPSSPATPGPGRTYRPIVVAGPSDALRAAADRAFDKGWTIRVAELRMTERAPAVADRFLGRVEEILPEARRSAGEATKGLVAVAMSTLDVPDGVPEEEACRAFVERARGELRRREESVSILRTAGPLGDAKAFGGAVVGAPTDPDVQVPPGVARALRMRSGITDVGLLTVGVLARDASAKGP